MTAWLLIVFIGEMGNKPITVPQIESREECRRLVAEIYPNYRGARCIEYKVARPELVQQQEKDR